MKNETESKLKYPRQDAQHYHDEIKVVLQGLTYKEKFNIIKKVDIDLFEKFNRFKGTKAVHTLDYLNGIPNKKKKNLNITEELFFLLRSLFVATAVKKHFTEKNKQQIKIVK
jgi:hypothetical protein